MKCTGDDWSPVKADQELKMYSTSPGHIQKLRPARHAIDAFVDGKNR